MIDARYYLPQSVICPKQMNVLVVSFPPSSGPEEPLGSAGSVPPRSFWPASPGSKRRPAGDGGLRSRPPLGLPPDERSGGGSCCRLWPVPCGEPGPLQTLCCVTMYATSQHLNMSQGKTKNKEASALLLLSLLENYPFLFYLAP